MKRSFSFLVTLILAMALSGCAWFFPNGTQPEQYGAVAVDKGTGQTVQAGGYNFSHYEFTVQGSHMAKALTTTVQPGELDKGVVTAFSKVPVGNVTFKGRVVGLDGTSTLSTIEKPLTVEVNKTTTVFLSAPAPLPPSGSHGPAAPIEI